jgi:hypothetical protein
MASASESIRFPNQRNYTKLANQINRQRPILKKTTILTR